MYSYQADEQDTQQKLMEQVQQLTQMIASAEVIPGTDAGHDPDAGGAGSRSEPKPEKKLTNQLANFFKNM